MVSNKSLCILTILGCLFIQAQKPLYAGEIVAGGTGMALQAMRTFAKAYSDQFPETEINVPPSLGTTGGLRALADDVIQIALSARDLKPEELSAGLQQSFCFSTALVLAGHPNLKMDISLSKLPDLYADPVPFWPDGTLLKVILRAASGSEMPYLSERVPGLGKAFASARQRRDVLVGITDQHNASLAEQVYGSLAITTLLQIKTEQRKLAPISIDGILPSSQSFSSNSYPFPLKVCLVTNKKHPNREVQGFVDFMQSREGHELVTQMGAWPEE
ncbi:hypothetical protein JCM17960_26850 [Magnetospira thiophila]